MWKRVPLPVAMALRGHEEGVEQKAGAEKKQRDDDEVEGLGKNGRVVGEDRPGL